jgi:phosphoserine aminotransferase
MIDLEIVYQLKKQYPGKLIAVDVVSSVPDVKLDFRYLDCVFFSVQKGFGLPSGLGVLIVSPQALLSSSHQGEAATLPSSLLYQGGLSLSFPQFQGGVGGGYHSFPSLLKYSQKRQTPETPNVLAIYLLGQVAQDMLKYGLDRIREETSQKAKLLYGFFGSHPEFQPFIRAPGLQSRTIIPINVKKGSTSIIAKLAEQGIVVGTGYQNYRSTQIRIANFPAHTTKHIQKLIRASSAHLV